MKKIGRKLFFLAHPSKGGKSVLAAHQGPDGVEAAPSSAGPTRMREVGGWEFDWGAFPDQLRLTGANCEGAMARWLYEMARSIIPVGSNMSNVEVSRGGLAPPLHYSQHRLLRPAHWAFSG